MRSHLTSSCFLAQSTALKKVFQKQRPQTQQPQQARARYPQHQPAAHAPAVQEVQRAWGGQGLTSSTTGKRSCPDEGTRKVDGTIDVKRPRVEQVAALVSGDINIKVGEKNFLVHRRIIANNSEFLAAHVMNAPYGGVVLIKDINEIQDIKACVFDKVLAFMYDKSFMFSTLPCALLYDVLDAALRLKVAEMVAAIRKTCEEVLRPLLNPGNCALVLDHAHRIGLSELYAEAWKIAKEHFAAVATQNALPASSMLSLLKSDDLAVKSEDEVFETAETVMAWLNAVHAARMRAPACAVPARRV